ncbi:hypothetical protein [Halomarina pelagica]|uniref:hypothetical protein n=1 Tax=Halomarina pelagica TaxID=2961599 RepID=UPI0020C33DB8|nr:hypothetical protein [Halomarina sp. BND7]
MAYSRRTVLRAGSISVFGISGAGCLSSSRGATDIDISNETTDEITVTIAVTSIDDSDIIVEETMSLSPNEEQTVNNKVLMHTDNLVEVTVQNGPSDTYEWNDAVSPLAVRVTNGEITFERLNE